MLIPSTYSFSQNYSYKYISTKEGLPSSTITGVTKDKNGIIWIGTEKGLCYISNGKVNHFKGLPDEGVLAVFASSDGSIWVGYGANQFLAKIKNGKVTSYAKQAKAKKNGSVTSMFENNKSIYLAQTDGITVISPDGKFKPLVNKIVSDTMMSYWTVDFFRFNNKIYATSVLRGVNEVVVREKDVVFKNIYKGEFLYGSMCSGNYLLLTFDPDAKLFNAKQFIAKQNQKPLKTVSSHLPAAYVSDKRKNIFGACYNINYGFHGLIRLDSKFHEQLIIPENIPGQELYYDEENNEIYFGSGFGLYIVNASLYSKFFKVKTESSQNQIFSSYPVKDGVIALTEEGLFSLYDNNSIKKHIKLSDLTAFAIKTIKREKGAFYDLLDKEWSSQTLQGLQLDDLKWVNNKWVIFSRIGFFIVNKNFEITDFIPIPASNLNFTKEGSLIFDQYRLSLIILKTKPKPEIVYDCFRQKKKVLKHIMGIERFGQKTIVITENQGVYSFDKNNLQAIKLKNLNTDVYRSSSFQNRYLVVSTVNGDILFYDNKKDFKWVKTIDKSQFYNESIIDLKGNENYLVFITSKRIFIWDGKSLKSYNEYQNGVDRYNRINLNGTNLAVYAPTSIVKLELPKLLQEINKKSTVNVTNQFSRFNEPIFNNSNSFQAKDGFTHLQFSFYNELNTDFLNAYYRIEKNKWIEIEQSGKIFLQNLDFGKTTIEFKVFDKRTGKITWQRTYFIINPAPWYLQVWAIVLYFILFSLLLILTTRFIVIKTKSKEIERLTISNRLNELQMEALQSQMNPHFVFNALNSVQKFILNIDQEKALLFLNQFSVLIRRVLDYSSVKSISIEEELEFLKLYLAIENQRFQDSVRLEQTVSCDEEITIPPLLIQPLIENAIIYGARNEAGELVIYFSIIEENNNLKIEIKNELNPTMTKNHAFQSKSTEIIQKRLTLYDVKATFTTTIKGSFYTAAILLPIND